MKTPIVKFCIAFLLLGLAMGAISTALVNAGVIR